MSTSQRYVAVKLIAGKKYVLRNGRHVTVKDNPHWQCAAKFPFFVMQGPDFIVYFTPEGQADPAGGTNEYDIIRPVYEPGEVYIGRDGQRHKIERDDNDTNYPLENDDHSWTRAGRCIGTTYHDYDLMDFAPIPAPGCLLPKSAFEIAPPADPWMGKRVQFNQDGERGTGIVRGFDGTNYAVEVDESCTEFSGGHYCGNLVPGGRGWFVHPRNLTAIDGIEPVVPSIVHDVSPDLPILATPVTPSRVGMRVEVQLDCATTVQATIMHEDAAHVAIEFDPDYYHAGAWTCDGHVPSGRGWYVPKDSVRAVSEAETQVEAERSEAEALNEVDVAEVWAAYRINPSISIDAWIAARRQLKAAAK